MPLDHHHFSVLWNNDSTHPYDRSMSKHSLTLRDLPLRGRRLYLDNVFVRFRPAAEMVDRTVAVEPPTVPPTTVLVPWPWAPGDSAAQTWRTETSQLMVRTKPGFEYCCYAVLGTHSDEKETGLHPTRQLVYSGAYAACPSDEASDPLCRTYRPIRDVPVAHIDDALFHHHSELNIELCFPLLSLPQLPNYRILSVLCEFSVQE